MVQPNVPQDDLMDVMEMTSKLEASISDILKDNDQNLAISALMSASINCLLAQCDTMIEVAFYRNLFIQILDSSIRHIEIKEPEKKQP